MRKAGVAELKAQLSRYLGLVKGGTEVLVTEHGVAIAKLVPLQAAERRGARRDRLAREGVLRLGRKRVRKSLLTTPKGRVRNRGVVSALIDERRTGR